jgi:Tfp pilus assembly protein PilF
MENRLSPMRELLGEMLLDAGRPADALREFERSLQTIPGRFRSIAGAAAAAAQSGNRAAATTYYRQMLALTPEADSERPAIAAARAYLTQ